MKESILQISKIVGNAESLSWAQVHVFLPQTEEKKRKFGNLIAAISISASDWSTDIGSFGTEIITRLQETYYSSKAKTVLKKLDEAFEKLNSEFGKQVKLALSLSVFLSKDQDLVLYAVLNQGRLAILREGRLGILYKGIGEKKAVSGFLKNNDFLCLATEQFFGFISYGVLKASMEGKRQEEAVESLAPIIHGRAANSQTAAVFIKVKKPVFVPAVVESSESNQEPVGKNKIPPKTLGKIGNYFTSCFSAASAKLSLLIKKSRPSIYIRKDSAQLLRQKKTNFTIAVVMIGLLLVSIFFGLKKEDNKEIGGQGGWLDQVENQLNQVDLLKESNPLKARSILKEIEEILKEKESEVSNKKKVEKIDSFRKSIGRLEEEVMRQYKVENPEVFLDLRLVKESFKGSNVSLAGGKIVALDKETGAAIDIDLKTKASKIIVGSQDLKEAGFLASTEARVYILKNKRIFVVDKEKEEIIQEKKIDDLGKAVDFVGFSDSVYLLDKTKSRILKFEGVKKGLLSEVDYLKNKKEDLSESVSLAIDGSVWVLSSDGKLDKYTRGYEDAFLIMGLDEPFNQPTAVYTDENCDNLYILDRNNTRVVVISKTSGDYQGSYIWSGIAGAIDFVVSEQDGRMLFLTGSRIYEIELKK